MSETVFFDDALGHAKKWVLEHLRQLGGKVVIIRDFYGRIRIATKRSEKECGIGEDAVLALSKLLGSYSLGKEYILLYPEDTLFHESIFDSKDAHLIEGDGSKDVRLLDRQITGQDWLRPIFDDNKDHPARATFFGIKGGVGRSTAIVILALELAKQGKKVLTLDFDLESPGISSLLLPPDQLPTFGIVDWLVEDGVGQGDLVLNELVKTSPLGNQYLGQIRVVPCYGQKSDAYIEKLSRAYVDAKNGSNIDTFAQRLHRLLTSLEKSELPDVVLIDSRAGLHDLAAIAITRLRASVFLFATRSNQTWSSYGLLFKYWQRNSQLILNFRDNLKVVDALVPETDREQHLEGMISDSYKLFEETIYEETAAEDWEAYNFQRDNEDGPHYPLPIRWNRAFQEFDPILRPSILGQPEIDAAYGDFVKGALRHIFGE
jgi:cellulose biosynthesis protein BcsQ